MLYESGEMCNSSYVFDILRIIKKYGFDYRVDIYDCEILKESKLCKIYWRSNNLEELLKCKKEINDYMGYPESFLDDSDDGDAIYTIVDDM